MSEQTSQALKNTFQGTGVVLIVGFFLGIVGPKLLTVKYHQVESSARPAVLSAFSVTKELVVKAESASSKCAPATERIYALIVNHHLFAPDLIACGIRTAQKQRPSVILLVSPNHFQAGRAPFLTTAADWQTAFGIVKSDSEIVRFMDALANTAIQDWPFSKEHGIGNIIPFLRNAFPNVPIVPLMVKDRVSLAEAAAYADKLFRLLPDDALVIGSFDFVHNKPEGETARLDSQSLSILEQVDPVSVSGVEVDSRPGLALVVQLAKLRGAHQFRLLVRDSVARRIGKPDSPENVSYLIGLFTN